MHETSENAIPEDDFERARGTLLIYAPVQLHRHDGRLWLESQACNGLRLWAENFERLIAVMPLAETPPPPSWIPLDEAPLDRDRIRIESVPIAYRPDRFLVHLPATRRRLHALIAESDYLAFGIGGLFGDWGAVACLEAARMGRPYAVCTDRVESEVCRRGAGDGPWRRRLRARLEHRPMAMLERAVIRRASLGLFHGRENFDAYAPYCVRPEVVHDIHLARADHIAPHERDAKIATIRDGPLRIVYVGRAEAMKGPFDWIAVLARLAAEGVDFEATWMGEGSLLSAMRERIAAAGLDARVDTPGMVTDRVRVLAALREAHLLLFCHKTPESPRCLVEALASACPIVGYGDAYAREITERNGGGAFVARDDVAGLARLVAGLHSDRPRLADLVARAGRDGAPFHDVGVFRHRSRLLVRHLPPPSHRLAGARDEPSTLGREARVT